MSVTFAETTTEHILPWEDRLNFDNFDILRMRLRVNHLWLKIIKLYIWRRQKPHKVYKKRLKDKKKLKDLKHFIKQEIMSS